MITILIVDDDNTLQIALTRRLRACGYNVINATSGAEALAKLGDQPVDVVVSDILMPEMSGFRVLPSAQRTPRRATGPFYLFVEPGGTQ